MTRADEKQTNLKKYEEYFLRYQLTDRMVKSAAKPDENFRDRKFVWDGADHPTSTGISERRPNSDADADETQSVESYQAEIDSDGGGSSSDQVAEVRRSICRGCGHVRRGGGFDARRGGRFIFRRFDLDRPVVPDRRGDQRDRRRREGDDDAAKKKRGRM